MTGSTIDATTVDWTDACARARVLTIAYYEGLSGGREIEIRTRSHDVEDLVRFKAADLEKLRIEMQQAQSACARSTGAADPNRRFPIRLGYRRLGPSVPDPYDPRG